MAATFEEIRIPDVHHGRKNADFGIITSGFIPGEVAMQLLMLGPSYQEAFAAELARLSD